MKQLILALTLLVALPLTHRAQDHKHAPPTAQPGGYLPTGNTYIKSTHQFEANVTPDAVVAYLRQLLPQTVSNRVGYKLVADIASKGGRHLTFAQTIDGQAVYGATVKVNLDKKNRCLSVLNGAFDLVQISLDEPFGFNADPSAVQTKALLAVEGGQVLEEEAMWWVDADRHALPVYRVATIHDGTACSSNDVLLEGASSQVLYINCRAVYFRPVDTTAQALVFMPDPLTSAEVSYSGQYRDNNDADNPALNAERVQVTLQGVSYEPSTGVFSLTGPHVNIQDIESPNIAVVTSTDGEFFYTRSQSGFEDANVYYHIDFFQRRAQSLGFFTLANFPLRVDPHGNNGDDNSYFIPGSQTASYISLGEGGIDDAEDADVIIHEYGHALSSAGSPNSNSGTERRGLDEGIGDYFAASYSRDINDHNWQKTFSWDGNEFWNGRSCGVTRTYPQLKSSFDSGNIYAYGELWATCLMKAWSLYGADIMDELAFQELYMNNSNQTIADAARLIIDADTMLYGGQYTPGLVDAFCSLQVLTGSYCTVASVQADASQVAGISVQPNPVNSTVVKGVLDGNQVPVRLQLIDVTGRVVANLQPDDTNEQSFDTAHLPAGLYVLQAEFANGTKVSQKVLKP